MNSTNPFVEAQEDSSKYAKYHDESEINRNRYQEITLQLNSLFTKVTLAKDRKHMFHLLGRVESHAGPKYPSFNPPSEQEVAEQIKQRTHAQGTTVVISDLLSKLTDKNQQETADRICSILFSYAKRKNKSKKEFPIRLFTPGTTFINNVDNIMGSNRDNPIPKTLTVKSIHCNGPDNYVVISQEIGKQRCFEDGLHPYSFHTSYVTNIINHVPGDLTFDRYEGGYDYRTNKLNDAVAQYMHEAGVKKKSNEYLFDEYAMVIYRVLLDLGLINDIDMRVDCERLSAYLHDIGVILALRHPEYGYFHVANKKRLKKAVRQNYNRFLVSKKKQLQEEEKLNREMYDGPWDDVHGDDE